jgi:hypothetical protein
MTNLSKYASQQWTPGPWQVTPTGYRIMWVGKQSDGTIIDSSVICDTATNKASRTKQNAANAKLIAKAPEMAQLLIDFVDYSECHCTNGKGDCIFCAAKKVLREAGAL